MYHTRSWAKLDNAAKIFPPTTTSLDTKVFRLSCELFEIIEPDILQTALDKTIIHFPFYRSVLRRGFFWYYFEESNLNPRVKKENGTPCCSMYSPNYKKLLFEISWYRFLSPVRFFTRIIWW